MKKSINTGFTLIEIAIVLVIIASLLSYAFMPLRAQMETANIKKAHLKLNEIEESLYGFAIANERLPCPTLPGQGGIAQPAILDATPPIVAGADSCTVNIGFVPSTTLGLKGEVNCDGLLMDPWGRPYYYSVTNADASNNWDDFVERGQLKSIANGGEGIDAVNPDIQICNNLDVNCTAGAPASAISTNNAVAVIFSRGTRSRPNSADENENAGEGANIASGCGLAAYQIGNDRFYYGASRREINGQEFDDIVTWISPNRLYSKMLKAGIIP